MKSQTATDMSPHGIGDDLLIGADAIAKFLFGPNGSRRRIYYMAACTRIPVFRMGSQLCARRSVLLKWITQQENRVLSAFDHATLGEQFGSV
jgi:hypothetical protein